MVNKTGSLLARYHGDAGSTGLPAGEQQPVGLHQPVHWMRRQQEPRPRGEPSGPLGRPRHQRRRIRLQLQPNAVQNRYEASPGSSLEPCSAALDQATADDLQGEKLEAATRDVGPRGEGDSGGDCEK
jgi:hypothetical protein